MAYIGLRYVDMDGFAANLKRMLDCMEQGNQIWYVDDLWIDGTVQNFPAIKEDTFYTKEELVQAFETLTEGFIQQVRIRRYDAADRPAGIDAYQDYKSSGCSAIILCCDVYYFDCYTKKEQELLRLYGRCRAEGVTELERFGEEDDTRTGMHVW